MFDIVYLIPLCHRARQRRLHRLGSPRRWRRRSRLLDPHADNPAIDLPSWQYVAPTGNSNGGGGACCQSIEDALRDHEGETVLAPQFDLTCHPSGSQPEPDSALPAVITAPNYGCPAGALGGGSANYGIAPELRLHRAVRPERARLPEATGLPICRQQQQCMRHRQRRHVLHHRQVRARHRNGQRCAGVGSCNGDRAIKVQLNQVARDIADGYVPSAGTGSPCSRSLRRSLPANGVVQTCRSMQPAMQSPQPTVIVIS